MADKKIIEEMLNEYGIKPANAEFVTERFLKYISDSIDKFPEFFTQPIELSRDESVEIIGYVVGYSETDDIPTYGRCIGRTRYNKSDKKVETQNVICIKEECIAKGREYTIMCFWHEFVHCLVDFKNPPLFHAMLDGLLKLYEERTGEHIENDYCDPV